MAWTDAARAAALAARRAHATDAVRKNIRLFHGTSSRVDLVMPKSYVGRKNTGVWLTSEPRVARAFARLAAKDIGGQPVVHVIRASKVRDLFHTGGYFATTKPLVGSRRYRATKKP